MTSDYVHDNKGELKHVGDRYEPNTEYYAEYEWLIKRLIEQYQLND
jgi:hypothetical protein